MNAQADDQLFDLTRDDDQRMNQDTMERFSANEIRAVAKQADEDGKTPQGFYDKTAELGLSLLPVPEALGGAGMARSPVSNALNAQDLAWGDLSLTLGAITPQAFVNTVLDQGSDAQREKYLPRFCEGPFVAATTALMEPRATFDPMEPACTATANESGYLLKGRGRKVTAEITIPRQVLEDVLRTTPERLRNSHSISTLSAHLTHSSNNAAHPANGLAALYMATGQDMANIGEANQCSVYSYVTSAGDLYYSITLPALIMATFGGGTGLATQRECLELMGCYGKGKAYKLLEIAAGLVVAGELSLVSAAHTDKTTGTNEWVDAHEKLGRNR